MAKPKQIGMNDTQGTELPDELRQLVELKRQDRQNRLEALSKIIVEKRSDAIKARKESGIEQIWKDDEEYYMGVDDENRSNHPYTKSTSTEGGLSSNNYKERAGRCSAFFNVTRQFVDSASARMGDILLPSGDWNFLIKPTPMPELDKIKGSSQAVVSPSGNTVTNQDTGKPYTLGEFYEHEMAEATAKVELAEQQILDWLTECHLHTEERKVIDMSARIGTGILRGAYPTKKKTRVVINGALTVEESTIPGSKFVHPERFYPDPDCGDNIQNGGYCFEYDYISARQLRDLKDMPGYLSEAIESVIKEGAEKCNLDDEGKLKADGTTKNDDRFKIWYFFGEVDLNDLKAMDVKIPVAKNELDTCPTICVVVNDTVIKGFLNPLDNGEFPYDVMPWQRMHDSVWGVGVARQGRTAQDMLNGAFRTLMQNMGISGSPQIIIRQSAVEPVDGEWNLIGGKFWYATEEADVRSVSDAFTIVNIPSMQKEISEIIAAAYKLMEDSTGVTFLLQGQQGSAPDTVGGMELLHKNSSSLLRRIARIFDECITEPHIRRYYDWLLLHGKDEMKGDLKIQAIGSSALVEREIQATQALQILQMANNPAYEMSPVKAKNELLRAWRFEPSKFDMDDEEKKAAAQRQPAPAPAVQAAQIRAQSAEKIATGEQQIEQIKIQKDTDRDNVYVQSETSRDQANHEYDMQKLYVERELEMMKYANAQKVSLDSIKAQLAQTSMKLNTQTQLSEQALQVDAAKHATTVKADLHKHATQLLSDQVMAPPTEPVGKAPAGQGFER